MKQIALFEPPKKEQAYTTVIPTPVYEPRAEQPHIASLLDKEKASRLIREIDTSNVSDAEKQFLKLAAYRHIVFNYQRIADYYAHASKEMQHLMEQSALVILDFEDAILKGYVQVCTDIEQQFLTEYPDANRPVQASAKRAKVLHFYPYAWQAEQAKDYCNT